MGKKRYFSSYNFDEMSLALRYFTLLVFAGFFILGCARDDPPFVPFGSATPLEVVAPAGLPPFPVNEENPLTVEGVRLGRHLFYDPLLSADFTMSCASCHQIGTAFTDPAQFSVGIDGIAGSRNAMPLFNMAYHPDAGTSTDFTGFFWDGRSGTLEDQALIPVEDPIEMHNTIPEVVARLIEHADYPTMFLQAYGTDVITPDLISNAIAQFERSIVSANTPFDQMLRGEIFWDDDVFNGWQSFNSLLGGDCFHCHGINGGLFTDFVFRNNGLEPYTKAVEFLDQGLAAITGDTADAGKFKTPTLRNIALTAPYMHDGRFATLEEVIDFYSEGVHDTPFTDPLMERAPFGGVELTPTEKTELLAFLNALTDPNLATVEEYQDPFE